MLGDAQPEWVCRAKEQGRRRNTGLELNYSFLLSSDYPIAFFFWFVFLKAHTGNSENTWYGQCTFEQCPQLLRAAPRHTRGYAAGTHGAHSSATRRQRSTVSPGGIAKLCANHHCTTSLPKIQVLQISNVRPSSTASSPSNLQIKGAHPQCLHTTYICRILHLASRLLIRYKPLFIGTNDIYTQ